MNKVGVQGYQKDPLSLIYPMYLNPLSSSYQWTSPSHVFTSYSDCAISFKLHPPIDGLFQCLPLAPNPLLTLKLGEVSVWAKNLSRICNLRGRSRGKLREIVLMIVGLQSLTLKCISRVFSLKFSLQFRG